MPRKMLALLLACCVLMGCPATAEAPDPRIATAESFCQGDPDIMDAFIAALTADSLDLHAYFEKLLPYYGRDNDWYYPSVDLSMQVALSAGFDEEAVENAFSAVLTAHIDTLPKGTTLYEDAQYRASYDRADNARAELIAFVQAQGIDFSEDEELSYRYEPVADALIALDEGAFSEQLGFVCAYMKDNGRDAAEAFLAVMRRYAQEGLLPSAFVATTTDALCHLSFWTSLQMRLHTIDQSEVEEAAYRAYQVAYAVDKPLDADALAAEVAGMGDMARQVLPIYAEILDYEKVWGGFAVACRALSSQNPAIGDFFTEAAYQYSREHEYWQLADFTSLCDAAPQEDGILAFTPAAPEPGLALMVTQEGDDGYVRQYMAALHDAIPGLHFTSDPDKASVLFFYQITYTQAGQYGPMGSIQAYSSNAALRACALTDARLPTALIEATRSPGGSIRTAPGVSKFYCMDPDLTEDDDWPTFVEAVARLAGAPQAPTPQAVTPMPTAAPTIAPPVFSPSTPDPSMPAPEEPVPPPPAPAP